MSDGNDETSGGSASGGKAAARPKIKVQLDEAVSAGTYANMALIASNESEFVLDFIFVPPTGQGAKVRSRIIISPRQAKRIAATLTESIQRYEARFGAIPLPAPGPEPSLH